MEKVNKMSMGKYKGNFWRNRDNVVCALCGEIFYEKGLDSHVGKKHKE